MTVYSANVTLFVCKVPHTADTKGSVTKWIGYGINKILKGNGNIHENFYDCF